MDSRQLLVFLSIFLSFAWAYDCPELDGCSACSLHLKDNSYMYQCPLTKGPRFTIRYKTQQYVFIECDPSANWSDLAVSTLPNVDRANIFSFGRCSLPNKSLADVAYRLGMTNVTNLGISGMSLQSQLKPLHLMGFDEVRYLSLTSLGLTDVEENLLQGLPNLEKLDLRDNKINISEQFFSHVPKLEVLELAQNNISYLEPGVFDHLKNLKLLNIWSNAIRKLENEAFRNMGSLRSLDLHGNYIQDIESEVFSDLENLEVINLDMNNFTSLPEKLFQNNKKLRTIKLSNNMQKLQRIPEGLFRNLTKLRELKLQKMGLQELPGEIFKDLKGLKTLVLSNNGLQFLSHGLFEGTSGLTLINLSQNNLTVIDRGIFYNLYSLEELNISRNRLKVVDPDAFKDLNNLKIADFSHNDLSLERDVPFEYHSPFRFSSKITELRLHHNRISQIFEDWRNNALHIERLDLSHNNISVLTTTDVHFISKNLRVDLTHNAISHILLYNAEFFFANQSYPSNLIIKVDINPMHCDCSIFTFLQYLEGKMNPSVQNYVHIDPGNLVCQTPKDMKGLTVTNIKSDKLQCLVDKEECPNECNCWRRPSDQTYIADCSSKNLDLAPEKLFPRRNEKVELNIRDNSLTTLPDKNQPGYENVSAIIASKNSISRIELDNLMDSLEILQLDSNKLQRLPNSILARLAQLPLKNVTLHSNPWTCDCEARDFKNFIQEKYPIWSDLGRITCSHSDQRIVDLTEDHLCSTTTIAIVLSSLVAVTGVILGLLAALYYRFSDEVKVWLYAHQMCLWFVTEDDLDKDKPYDVFISYSHKDEDFVAKELVTQLEQGPHPFKLCLHNRDWIPGGLIPVQIARSVESSKRTVIVLSPNFLKSVWGAMEFRLAHRKALAERRTRLIVILYGDIPPTEKLDKELQAYLNTNTYVKWGDRCFWDKLRYALPHPPEIRRRKKNIFRDQEPKIILSNDKDKLIESGLAKPLSSTPPNEVSGKGEDNLGMSDGVIINVAKLQCTTV